MFPVDWLEDWVHYSAPTELGLLIKLALAINITLLRSKPRTPSRICKKL